MTARKYDINNWFEVPDNPLSKVGIFPYSGGQIGAPDDQADRVFRVLRPPEELGDPEALASFRLIPIVDDHEMLGDGFSSADQYGTHGVIGENIQFDGETVTGNIKIFSETLAKKIKSGKKELSWGYRCQYDFTPGTYNGQEYDVVQRRLRGNHLALVDAGRMGPDVAVLDHMIFTVDAMEKSPVDKLEKLKAALAAMLTMLNEPDDGGAPPVIKPPVEDDKGTTPPADKPPVAPPVEDDKSLVPPADDAKDDNANAMDAANRTIAALKAQLAGVNGKVAALEGRPAMDEATMLGTLADRATLYDQLSPIVGAFDHAKMTVADMAKYGVDKLKIANVPAGQERIALDAYLQAKPSTPAALAMDNAAPVGLAAAILNHAKGA